MKLFSPEEIHRMAHHGSDAAYRELVLFLLFEVLNEESKMATKSDLDAAIATLGSFASNASNAVTSAIADFQAKLAAAGVTIDFTDEVNKLNAVATGLQNLGTTATAADPGAVQQAADGGSGTDTTSGAQAS